MTSANDTSPTSFTAETADSIDIFQVPGEVRNVDSRSHASVRIVIDTQENLTDEVRGRLMKMHEKYGWFTFMPRRILPEDVSRLPALKLERDEKSPSQRLRACIHILWEQKGKPTETSEQYYRETMEKLIEWVKEKLT
jgi:hypothetical protein